MRIVGGKFKGLTLAAPQGSATRPTSDRVREALFNILSHGVSDFEIDGSRALDLFAGTGALGLEALSRGSRSCHFIDESSAARGLIRENADRLGVIGQIKIWKRDAAHLGPCAPQPPYDLVFVDPPYEKGLGDKALLELVKGQWLAANAVVVLEESDRAVVAEVPSLALVDQRQYGETVVRFYRFTAA